MRANHLVTLSIKTPGDGDRGDDGDEDTLVPP